MTEPNQRWRERAVAALRRYYEHERFPRLIVMVLLLVTGGVGFLTSAGMLRLGVHEMWIRYPVAVLAAYIAFVALIRLWAEGERNRTDTHRALETADATDADRHPSSEWSGWEWLDAVDFCPSDLDGGCLPVLVLGALLALVIVLFAVICAAPGLLAEVFLDVALVAALYKRLSHIERRHWLATAIRRTWMPALSAAVVLALAGALMQGLIPEARSIGQVWEKLAGK
jgi:hypothetical protein